MANCVVAYQNRIDESTLSGGTWLATLPLNNLKNRVIAKVARTNGLTTAATQLQGVLPKSRLIRIVSLIAHNMTVSATYRLRLFSDNNFVTPIFDTGATFINVWPAAYESAALDWENDNYWDGALSEEDRAGFTANLTHILPTAVYAQSFRLELSDASNPAGYVQAGRVFLSGDWQPGINMDYGAKLGYETKTQVDESLSGTEYFERRPPYRVAQFNLGFLSQDEALQQAFDMQRINGIDGEIFYVYDPDDTIHALRRSFLGRLRQLSPIEQPYLDTFRTSFEIRETI